MRLLISCLLVLLFACPYTDAHEAEPISTEFARPFEVRAGSVSVDFSHERNNDATVETIPETEIEIGVMPRFQINFGIPVVRLKESNSKSLVAGGHLEAGVRFMLFGGTSYALSAQGTVEAPTGDRSLFGSAVGLGPGLFFEKEFGSHFRLHTNLSWTAELSDESDAERTLDYHNAIVWFANRHVIPVVELLGTTDTRHGETELSVQPEVIVPVGRHVEFKAGVPFGLTDQTPAHGFRAQFAFLWGG